MDFSIYEVPIDLTKASSTASSASASGSPSRSETPFGDWSDMIERIRASTRPLRSPWSASTSSCTTPTSRSTRPSPTRASPTTWTSPAQGLGGDPRVDRGAEGHSTASTACSIPGGFGERGLEGKMRAIRFARENGVPFFGICLGHAVRGRSSTPATSLGLEGANTDRARGLHAAPGHQPHGRPGGSPPGRDHEARRLRLRRSRGTLAHELLRRGVDLRAAPAPVRVQQRIPGGVQRLGDDLSGVNPERDLVEIVETPRPPVLHRRAVPPRVQEQARSRRSPSSVGSSAPPATACERRCPASRTTAGAH